MAYMKSNSNVYSIDICKMLYTNVRPSIDLVASKSIACPDAATYSMSQHDFCRPSVRALFGPA